MNPDQRPRTIMDPHEDWQSHHPSRPSIDTHEDWLAQQKSIADKIAKETRELKEENVMLRENTKKAQEIAAADDKEKTALQEQVVELKGKVEQLERAVDHSRKFIERSFGAIAAGARVDISSSTMLTKLPESEIPQPIDDAVMDMTEEESDKIEPEVQTEVPQSEGEAVEESKLEEGLVDISILGGLPVQADGSIKDSMGKVVGFLVKKDMKNAKKYFQNTCLCDSEGRVKNSKGKIIAQARALAQNDAPFV